MREPDDSHESPGAQPDGTQWPGAWPDVIQGLCEFLDERPECGFLVLCEFPDGPLECVFQYVSPDAQRGSALRVLRAFPIGLLECGLPAELRQCDSQKAVGQRPACAG